MPRLLFFAVLVVAIGVAGRRSEAQIPDAFENLQVLPKDIAKTQLVPMMRGFAGALGVPCAHCHVGPDDLAGMDFATDEKRTKRTAREMIRMVNAINNDYLAAVDTGRKVEVTCLTCHRGLQVPRSITDVIQETLESDGLEAAKKQYAGLREEYYGKGSYDFGPDPLNRLAGRAFQDGEHEVAFALVDYMDELFPDDVRARTLRAIFHRNLGQKGEALAAFREALTLAPDEDWIKNQIEQLESDAETSE